MKPLVGIIFVILVIIACFNNDAKQPFARLALGMGVRDDTNAAIIRLHTTANEGTWPGFGVTLHGDGRVEWRGEEYVRHVRDTTYHVDRKKVRDLIRMMSDRQFQSLPDSIGTEHSDHLTTITSIEFGSVRKRVITEYARDYPSLDSIDAAIVCTARCERFIDGHNPFARR
jgi:hypothetical protein